MKRKVFSVRVVLTPDQMKRCDAYTAGKPGLSSLSLMERAAHAALLHMADLPAPGKVVIYCGCGNNGGDGYALARFLLTEGLPHPGTTGDADRPNRFPTVTVVQVTDPGRMTEECRTEAKLYLEAGGDIRELAEACPPSPDTLIVDAILGIGISGNLRGAVAAAIEEINLAHETGCTVLSLDIPTGIDARTGNVHGTAVHADLTVSFGQYKTGQMLFPAADYMGRLLLCPIGIEADAPGLVLTAFAMEKEEIAAWYPRPAYSNKGTYGRVLCLVGSETMCGAALLCAKGAYRTGAGMVEVLTAACNRTPLVTSLPEAIVTTFRADTSPETTVTERLSHADALVIGCGMSQSDTALAWLGAALPLAGAKDIPTVLDADALNLLASHPALWALVPAGTVLTPHPGEMARLCGCSVADITADPLSAAQKLAAAHAVICVLKDAATVVAAPDGTLFFPVRGNAGMATGGSGDVLAGVIGATLAAKCRTHTPPVPFSGDAPLAPLTERAALAAAAASLHAMGGNRAAEAHGTRAVLAGDIADCLWSWEMAR